MVIVSLRSNRTLGQLRHHPLPLEWMLCGPGAQGHILPCSSLAGPILPVCRARLALEVWLVGIKGEKPFSGNSFDFLLFPLHSHPF